MKPNFESYIFCLRDLALASIRVVNDWGGAGDMTPEERLEMGNVVVAIDEAISVLLNSICVKVVEEVKTERARDFLPLLRQCVEIVGLFNRHGQLSQMPPGDYAAAIAELSKIAGLARIASGNAQLATSQVKVN